MTDLVHLERLLRDRKSLEIELDLHLKNCLRAPPHGYLVCQLQRERLTRRLAEIDRAIAALQHPVFDSGPGASGRR